MGKHRGDEHWRVPLQTEPPATKFDYLLLVGALAMVVACCGFVGLVVKILFL